MSSIALNREQRLLALQLCGYNITQQEGVILGTGPTGEMCFRTLVHDHEGKVRNFATFEFAIKNVEDQVNPEALNRAQFIVAERDAFKRLVLEAQFKNDLPTIPTKAEVEYRRLADELINDLAAISLPNASDTLAGLVILAHRALAARKQ